MLLFLGRPRLMPPSCKGVSARGHSSCRSWAWAEAGHVPAARGHRPERGQSRGRPAPSATRWPVNLGNSGRSGRKNSKTRPLAAPPATPSAPVRTPATHLSPTCIGSSRLTALRRLRCSGGLRFSDGETEAPVTQLGSSSPHFRAMPRTEPQLLPGPEAERQTGNVGWEAPCPVNAGATAQLFGQRPVLWAPGILLSRPLFCPKAGKEATSSPGEGLPADRPGDRGRAVPSPAASALSPACLDGRASPRARRHTGRSSFRVRSTEHPSSCLGPLISCCGTFQASRAAPRRERAVQGLGFTLRSGPLAGGTRGSEAGVQVRLPPRLPGEAALPRSPPAHC